eukprot:16439142-Heterocapsa_arctica.AAC.1
MALLAALPGELRGLLGVDGDVGKLASLLDLCRGEGCHLVDPPTACHGCRREARHGRVVQQSDAW